jgi:hypothetical protein
MSRPPTLNPHLALFPVAIHNAPPTSSPFLRMIHLTTDPIWSLQLETPDRPNANVEFDIHPLPRLRSACPRLNSMMVGIPSKRAHLSESARRRERAAAIVLTGALFVIARRVGGKQLYVGCGGRGAALAWEGEGELLLELVDASEDVEERELERWR